MVQKITADSLKGLIKHRGDDSHKHQYGHLLLVCGCRNMPGAAVLATGAALKSGCGLVTLHSVETAVRAVVSNYPSAMLSIDAEDCFSTVPGGIGRYSAVAAGPGLGRDDRTVKALGLLMEECKAAAVPMVLDADAINILAEHREFFEHIPTGSVFTPHEGELRRLLPDGTPDEDIAGFCRSFNVSLVRKGFHSRVFTSDGTIFENTTGNAGLAKGGSGDVLTGLVGGLVARGYTGTEAAGLGVWIHGYAGDVLSEKCTAEAYSSKDLIDCLYLGFKEILEIVQHEKFLKNNV